MDIGIKMGENGMDIDSTIFGDIAITQTEDDDVIQSCIMLILIRRGEMRLHSESGNDILNHRNKLSSMNMVRVADECKIAMMQDERIRKVVSCVATKSTKIYGSCDVKFTVLTTYDKELTSNISFSIIKG